MTFIHPVLHDGETMVFWQAFDLALVLATVAVGAWKVLGFGQQRFDAGRDLFFSAEVIYAFFLAYNLLTGHTKKYRKYHSKKVVAIIAIVAKPLIIASFIKTVIVIAKHHKAGLQGRLEVAIAVLQGTTFLLTCFVWFLVHTRPAVAEDEDEDGDDYELGEMGSAQE